MLAVFANSVRQLFQITAPISPGNSGGPVLDAKGAVIGLAVASLTGGQNLNFAIPASYLAGLLKDVTSAYASPYLPSLKGADDLHGANWGPRSGRVVATHVSLVSLCVLVWIHSFATSLDTPIRALYCLVVFRDGSGDPVDTKFFTLSQTIPARLAKRFWELQRWAAPRRA